MSKITRLSPVWHRMLYNSCTHMAIVGVKGLSLSIETKICVWSNLIHSTNFASSVAEGNIDLILQIRPRRCGEIVNVFKPGISNQIVFLIKKITFNKKWQTHII